MLAFRLPPEIESRLEHMAAYTGRSAGFQAFETVLKRICELEDMYIAEQRLADLRAGWTETTKFEDLMRQFSKAG